MGEDVMEGRKSRRRRGLLGKEGEVGEGEKSNGRKEEEEED